MKKLVLLVFGLVAMQWAAAQLTTPPNGNNKKAVVGERIGITDVTIHYDRPGVKGREGKIWGQLVPYGMQDQGFGTSTVAPWRAGANENTTIEFTTPVKVEGRELAAGKYGFFVDLKENEANLIFSNDNNSWGSFFYDPHKDALRVIVKTEKTSESVEWLKYEFMNESENDAMIALLWEKLKIPFKVEVDLVKTQLESFRKELNSSVGFDPERWAEAAQYCADHNTNLEEALIWSDYSVKGRFVGKKTFPILKTRAAVLTKLNRNAEADSVMKEAVSIGQVGELHQYGRELLQEGKNARAMEVFQYNAKKNPNVFTTNMGLSRGYAANGDFKNALKYAKAALPQAPDKMNKDNLENMIKQLEQGKNPN